MIGKENGIQSQYNLTSISEKCQQIGNVSLWRAIGSISYIVYIQKHCFEWLAYSLNKVKRTIIWEE